MEKEKWLKLEGRPIASAADRREDKEIRRTIRLLGSIIFSLEEKREEGSQ